MRAAALLNGTISLAEVPEPPAPSRGQVTVAVDSCGICGSDLSLARDPEKFVRVARQGRFELAAFDTSRAVVPGHEFSGVVVGVGPDTDAFAVGDRVTGIGIATEPNGERTIIGYSNDYPGGFAERVTVDTVMLRHVPDHLSLEAASLAEPLHVGESHVQQSAISDADAALVIGAGSIGQGVVIALAARGISPIVVVEPSPRRRELATRLGAHVAVAPPEGGAVEALGSLANGQRVIAYECSGRQGTLRYLIENLPNGGAIQMVASPFSEESFVPVIGQWHNIVLNFGGGPTDDPYGVTLQRLSDGTIDPDLFITQRIGLAGVGEAFEGLQDPEAQVKVLVQPHAT